MKKIILLSSLLVLIGVFSSVKAQSTLFLNGVNGSTSTLMMDVSLINSGNIEVDFPFYLNGGNWIVRVDWKLPGGSTYAEVYSTSNNTPIPSICIPTILQLALLGLLVIYHRTLEFHRWGSKHCFIWYNKSDRV